MQNLITSVDKVLSMLYFDYIFATILIIWLLVKYVLPNRTKRGLVVLFSIGIAICSGAGFFFLGDYKIVNLILSGLTLVTFYEWFAKLIFKAFDMEYKSNDPELIKGKRDKEIVYPNGKAMRK